MTRFIAMTIFTLIAVTPVFAHNGAPALDEAPSVTQTVKAEQPIQTPTAPDEDLTDGPCQTVVAEQAQTITNGCICHTYCNYGQCFKHCTCN